MLAVTLLGFLLTGAATLIGFSRLDGAYNASRLVRKEAAVAKSLGFALKTGVGGAVEATSLSWTVMPGAFADRILEIEVQYSGFQDVQIHKHHGLPFEMGPYGSILAHIKLGQSHMPQDHF